MRKPALIAAGVSIAALLGLGTYLAIELHTLRGETVSPDAFAKLQQDLADAQQAHAEQIETSLDQQGAQDRALGNRLLTTLDDTTKAMQRHGSAVADAAEAMEGATDPILAGLENVNAVAAQQQRAIERLGEMLAHQQENDSGPELLSAMAEMKALMADQPTGDALVARLEEAIDSNAEAAGLAVQAALAEHALANPGSPVASAKSTDELLNRVLDRLAQVPTRDQIAEEVRLAVAEAKVQDEQFMRLLLAELRRTGDQITTDVAAAIDEDAGQAQRLADELRATDNESAAKTASMLESLLQKVDDQKALSEQILALRDQIESLPGRDDAAVRAVLSRLDQQDRNNTAMLAAIAELREAMPDDLPGRLDEVLTQLDEEVRTQQITDAIEQSMQRLAAAKDEQTAAALAEFSERLDAMPSTEELAEVAQSQQALAKLLDESDAREAVSAFAGDARATRREAARGAGREADAGHRPAQAA